MSKKTLLEELLALLPPASEKGRLEEIARRAGVPYHTLLKIVNRQTVDPRVSTVDNLLRHLRAREAA